MVSKDRIWVHLGRLLQRFAPAAVGESSDHGAMQLLFERGPCALYRGHDEPGHFTASALVVDPSESRVLLIFHSKLRLWLQPGGHIEATDRDVIASARREALEEADLAGLTLLHEGIFDIDVHDIPGSASAPAHKHFDLRFLFRASGDRMQAGSDALDARWLPLADFRSSAAEAGDESVARSVRKVAEHLSR